LKLFRCWSKTMKRIITWPLLTLLVLIGAFLKSTQTASSTSSSTPFSAAHFRSVKLLPMFTTTFDVDRTDDNAAATACTIAPNDCSLRGAIIAANANAGADPIVINLQAATTYNLTLSNASQENAAATGDLDITTSLHSVTVAGGGPLTVVDASGLSSGNARDRVFHVTASNVTAAFQDLTIRNGIAAD